MHGSTGLVVSDPHDVNAAARALNELLDDPERRAQMGRAGRERAVAGYSYDVLAERLGEALRRWEAHPDG